MSLSHIVGLITGGASGLGAGTAHRLLQRGAKIVIADVSSERYSGPAECFVNTDVTSEEQVDAALQVVEDLFGEPVNAVINCAGIGLAQKTLKKVTPKLDQANISSTAAPQFIPHSLKDFQRCLHINTLGSFNVARLAAARMALRDPDSDGIRGCIIHTASIAAMDGQQGQVAYAASKAALVGMTLPMARDLSPLGIRVMTIAPGLFQTPLLENLPEQVQQELGQQVPLPARLGRPDEFGALVEFILQNPMLNGEVIRLDGALRMPPK